MGNIGPWVKTHGYSWGTASRLKALATLAEKIANEI
ncbi:hypothetical protein BH11VER1_BH11VER1_26610 [soil metagenome]